MHRGLCPDWEKFYHLIVTDEETEVESNYPVARTPRLWTHGFFNLPVAYNAGIEYALAEGFDWVSNTFADLVPLNYPTVMPISGAGSSRIYYQQSGECLLQVNFAALPDSKWKPCSNMTVHRDLFADYRFCEDYYGYGFEDLDFICWLYFERDAMLTPMDMRCVHLDHPPSQVQDATLSEEERQGKLWSSPTQFQRSRKLLVDRMAAWCLRTGKALPNHMPPDLCREAAKQCSW